MRPRSLLAVAALLGGKVVHVEIITHYVFDPSPLQHLAANTEQVCSKATGFFLFVNVLVIIFCTTQSE